MANNLEQYKKAADMMPGCVGIYTIFPDDHIEPGYINEKSAGFESLESVHPEDREALIKAFRKAIADNAEAILDIRSLQSNGKYSWLNVRATVAQKLSDRTELYLLFTNVDDIYRARTLAKESQNIIRIASMDGKMGLWVYHIDSHKISQSFSNTSQYGYPVEIDGGYEEVIRTGGIHPDEVEAYRSMYQAIDAGASSSECTARIHYPEEDRYEWRHMILTRQQDEMNEPVAIGFGVNIELQKEAEIRYERENNLRQELVKEAVIYYRINLNTRMVEEIYSEAMDTSWIHLPISTEELVQHGLFDGCYEADRKLLTTMLNVDNMKKNYESGKSSENFVYRRYLPGKGLRWLKASIAKLKRVSSDDIIAFYTAFDIDEEKKDQILYRDVMNEEIESLITLKVHDKQIRVLKENRVLCGYDPKYPVSEYMPLTSEFRDSLFQDMLEEDIPSASAFIELNNVMKSLEYRKILQSTYRIRKKDGTVRRKKVRIFYLDESKEDIIFVRRDITDLYNEQKKQSAMIRRAMDDAKAANEAKSVFLSRMSHDMRTPLNAIIGYSGQILREGATEAQKDAFLNDIHHAGEYLLGIINDVLDMTKIESNKMVLHPESYSFTEFKNNIETVIRPLCEKKDIVFEIIVPKACRFSLLLDKVRFSQIFINILSNAVKFTPAAGKITLAVDNRRVDEHLVDATFIVSDTGCGMSEEFIPHAFDSFSQEYSSQSIHKEQGTGLGLSIVKQLVELMGGTVQLESRLGEGSTFTICMQIPLATETSEKRTAQFPENGLKGLHILLCEDHQMNRNIAVRLLEKEGVIVDEAVNGAEGVKKFSESEERYYDAVLMDIRMPVMNGIEAAKAIRALDREDAATVPMIAMTANAFAEDRRESLEAGMNDHLAKPIDPLELYQTIYHYTSNRQVNHTSKVLVVDDVEMNAEIVARTLCDEYETLIALSGKEALHILANNPYVIAVITDVQMPEMDGGELIRSIRSNPIYDHVALIANTDFGNSHLEEEMMKDGADDFIYKPTAPSLIRARVKNAIAKYQ